MSTIKEQLAALTPEQLMALKQELLMAQANGGNIMDTAGGRALLPQNTSLSARIGRGILSGAQAAGESVVRDVRSMAGFKEPEASLADQLKKLELEERIKNQVDQEDPYKKSQLAINQEILKNIQGGGAGGDLIYRDISTGQEVPQEEALAGIAQGKQYAINRRVISRQGTKEEPLIDAQTQKFNLELADKTKAQEEKSQFVKDSALDTLNTISEVEKGIGNFGLLGGMPSIPGTERATWEANVNKLLSGKIINLMTQMKEASKTGATGFGQLSEKELKVLQEASTALKRGISPRDAQVILNDMKAKIKKITQEGTTSTQTQNQNNDPLGLR